MKKGEYHQCHSRESGNPVFLAGSVFLDPGLRGGDELNEAYLTTGPAIPGVRAGDGNLCMGF